jgi:acyl-CoA thioesterase FadM
MTEPRRDFPTHAARARRRVRPGRLVRTASYADYFDTVAALWEVAAGPYEDLLGAGFAIAPAELHVHYLGLAELDDELKLEARIVRLGPSSIMTDRRDGGRAACRERARSARARRRPTSRTRTDMPQYVRTALRPYLHERRSALERVAGASELGEVR